MSGKTENRLLLWLLPLSLVVGFAFQGSRGLYESTEGRYAEVAREMVESGNYLEPTIGYRPHWTKPPLTYWSIAAGIRLLGRNEWAVRAASAVAFILTALAVGSIGAALWGATTGLVAGLIFLSSVLPVAGEASLSTDMLLTLWETLAVLCYVKALRASGGGALPPLAGGAAESGASASSARWWVVGLWVAFGLAFFTKGPPGLLPLLPLAVFHHRAGRPFRLLDPVGLVLFSAVGLWWYLLEIARHPELLSYFLGQEIIARNLTSRMHRNPQWYGPIVIYGPMLLLGPGLWLYYGIRLLNRWRLYRPRVLLARLKARGEPASLLLMWLFLPLVIFCLSRSRLPLYVLPLYAPIALAMARGLVGAGALAGGRLGRLAARSPVRLVRSDQLASFSAIVWLTAISAAGLVVVKGVASVVPNRRDMAALYRSVVQAGGPEAEVWAYREPLLNGLQFYLDGHLQRLSETGEEPWANRAVDAAVAAIASAGKERDFVLVTRERYARELAHHLADGGLAYSPILVPARSPGHGRVLFRVTGGG